MLHNWWKANELNVWIAGVSMVVAIVAHLAIMLWRRKR